MTLKTHTCTLLEISQRVYGKCYLQFSVHFPSLGRFSCFVFHSCFGTDEEDDIKDNFPESCSFMVLRGGGSKGHNMAASFLSESGIMNVVEYYPSNYAGCPLPPMHMNMIHHFLNSTQPWLSAGQHNILLIHCGWPAMAFMLEQASRELLLLESGSAVDPLPSQLRYLEYVSRNVGYQLPPPLNRTLRLDCVVLRLDVEREGCCSRAAFQIMDHDPFNDDVDQEESIEPEATSSSKTNNLQGGMCVSIKVPAAPSKIISPRISQNPPPTHLLQGSSVSRYPNSAPFSGIGITALLHDHASDESTRSVTVSPTAVAFSVKQSPPSSQSLVEASECTDRALSTPNATDESSTEHSEPPISKHKKLPVPRPPPLPCFFSNAYRSPLVKFSPPPPPPPPPPLPPVSKAFRRKPTSKAVVTLTPPPPPPPAPPLSLWKASSQKTVALPPSNTERRLSPSAKHVIASKLDNNSSQPFKSSAVISRPCLHPVSVPLPPAPPPVSALKKQNMSIDSKYVPSMPQPPPASSAKGLTKASFGVATNRNVPPPAPGPPSLLSFGGKDRGLSRSRNQVQPRKASLKPYHWLKLTRVTQGSIWAEAQNCNDTSMTPEFDISELESLFSSTSLTSDMKSTGVKSKRRTSVLKADKVQLIELRRAYNCEIMLTKVKIPLHELTSSVLALDDSVLDVDQVDSLVKFCPTKEEMELLKGYKGDKESLGKCEKFFLELMKVPRVESKLRVFSFKMQLSQQVSDLRRNLNIVNSAAEEIRSSTKFKRIMQSVLSLGNALNQGTARGSAVGFRLDSLLKLTDTRSRNNKITLMHYLCKVLAEKLPELLDFSKDLVSLEAATKIQLKYLAEEMQAISKGLEKVIQELAASENDGAVSEYFCKILRAFLSHAESEVKSLASLYSNVGRNADALALYFGEDPARCPFEQVLRVLF
ncbi:Formin-like protein 18 [Linum grandiflorum]